MSGLGDVVDDVHTRFMSWIQEVNAKSEAGSFVEYLTDSIIGLDVKLFDVIEVLKGLKTEWNDCWEAVHEGDWTRFSTFIKEDLPDPDTPVTYVINPTGNLTSTFFKL